MTDGDEKLQAESRKLLSPVWECTAKFTSHALTVRKSYRCQQWTRNICTGEAGTLRWRDFPPEFRRASMLRDGLSLASRLTVLWLCPLSQPHSPDPQNYPKESSGHEGSVKAEA
uniref:Uncharacterized protein n=1 Tax=Sphaerodactylus townsendi TaxID=933632 RepID=A0ACB8FSM2_9SAUR